MGRLILLLLIVLVVILVWKAFKPSTWSRNDDASNIVVKGPDDDEEFLWELEKRQFKERRAREEANRQRIKREQLRRLRQDENSDPADFEHPPHP